MVRRASTAAVIVGAVLWSVAASPAEAASLPAHAEVRAGRCVEPAVFRRLVASRYQIEFSHVVATDIDRDGDIDVVATTDRTFTVWLNDGDGHLTSQPPSHAPALDARAPAPTWRGGEDRRDPTTDDGGAPTVTLVAQAHAPPALDGTGAASIHSFPAISNRARSSAPRAPPTPASSL
jgi:VCBS repeat protein